MIIKTKNFNPETDVKLRCTCGHPKCDRRSVDQETLDRGQRVRDDVGALVVTSGGRCPYHPDEIHKDKGGDHQKCKGLDVRYYSIVQRNKIMVSAGRHGFNAVAFGDTFVHLGHRPELPEGAVVSWEYS